MEKNVSIPSIGLKWGLILGLCLALMTTTFAFLGIFGPWYVPLGLFLVLVVGAMVMGINEFKAGNDTLATFSQGLGLAMIVIAIGGFISTAYSYTYNNYIDTQYFQETVEHSLNKMVESGFLPEDKYDEALEEGTRRGSSIFSNLLNYVGFVVIGFIIALITSAIVQKKELDPSELAKKLEEREEGEE